MNPQLRMRPKSKIDIIYILYYKVNLFFLVSLTPYSSGLEAAFSVQPFTMLASGPFTCLLLAN